MNEIHAMNLPTTTHTADAGLRVVRAHARTRARGKVTTPRVSEMSGKTPWTPLASNDDEDDDRELMLREEQRSTGDGRQAATTPTTTPQETRETRDASWKYAFILTNALTAIIGLSAISSASRDARELAKPETLNAWATCHDANTGAGLTRRTLLEEGEGEDDDTAFAAAFEHCRGYMTLAAFGAVLIGWATLKFFQSKPREATWAMIYVKCASMIALSVMFFTAKLIVPGVLFALFAAFFAYWMRATRDRVELVAKLLGAASTALRDNPHLVTTSVLAGIGSAVALLFFVFCIMEAWYNGAVVANDWVVYRNGQCFDPDAYDESGSPVPAPCCAWRPDGWVPPYVALGVFTLLWTQMVAAEMRTFIVGGSISRWYFAPAGTTRFVGTTKEFVGHAFGASFGSLALGGLVLAGVQILRNLNERARRESRGAMAVLACLVTAVMDCLAEIIETVTKFATIQCAITGEALCDAGREVTRLLKDNFLSAVRVWWLPEMILTMASVVFAVAYGVVVGVSVRLVGRLDETEASIVGSVAGFVGLLVLSFLFNVLLVCVDAVFICYARDKDQNKITKPEIVAVYDEVTLKTMDGASAGVGRRQQQMTTSASAPPGPVFQPPGGQPMVYGNPTPSGGDNDNDVSIL